MGQASPIATASKDIDDIIHDLVAFVKRFKCPAELDFGENAMQLINNKKNKPFISQLRNYEKLRKRLAGIQTYNDETLVAKHKATGAAIGRALSRMKELQLKLYEKYAEAED